MKDPVEVAAEKKLIGKGVFPSRETLLVEVIESYKQELAEANKECGAWMARALAAEKQLQTTGPVAISLGSESDGSLLIENARLKRQLAGVQRANRQFHQQTSTRVIAVVGQS
jgi:hypothetical protein